MFAVVELGGKQYLVRENDLLRVEKLGVEDGATYKADKVLLISDGKTSKVGMPFIKGAAIDMKVLKSGLGDKVRVFKMKAKKRYKRTRGHRQAFTELKVGRIAA